MTWLKKIAAFELWRLFGYRKSIILLIFYLLTIYFIQSGISQHKEKLEEKKAFQEYERIRIENFQFYAQYGTYGFRLLYIPGPLSAFTGSAGVISNNINAFIDAGERVNIYESFQGKNPFKGYISVFLNLTGFILLFYSLLILFYGMEIYKDYEFLKFLDESFIGKRIKTFWNAFSARFILLIGSCLIIMLTAWALFIINGIDVEVGMLIIYFTSALQMLAFFLFFGTIAGSLKNTLGKIAAILLIWIVFVFFIPAAVEKFVYNRAESIMSTYKLEIEKFKIMMKIEKKAKEQEGRLDVHNTNTKIRQQLFEYFWKNEFREILDHEQAMINDMKRVVSLYHNLSLIFPTTFFVSVNNEIGGCGYKNLISFYENVLNQKEGFINYYAEKSFYSGEKTVKPFLKGEENICYASSVLPENFGFGIVFSLFWLLILLFILGKRHKWMSKQSIKTDRELNPGELKKNKANVIFTTDKGIEPYLVSKLKSEKISFVSVPNPCNIPKDTKVKKLFSLFSLEVPATLEKMRNSYIYELDSDDKGRILTEITCSLNADTIIFNNFLAGLSDELIEYFAEVIKTLKARKTIVYFTNSLMVSGTIADCGIRWTSEKISF